MFFDDRQKVLVVSSSLKAEDFIKNCLKDGYISEYARSGAIARQLLSGKEYDTVIINCPLKDEFGTDLAENVIKNGYAGVMLLVKSEVFDDVSYAMEKAGVYTLAKPVSSSTFRQGLALTNATAARLKGLARKTENLQEKMEEIRLVARAKLLLITKLRFSEEEAHKYIEKRAMDECVKRKAIAFDVIKTYGD